MAAVLAIARLCEPSSELHIAEHWFRTTALDDVLGIAPEQVNDDRLYRALDRLLPHKTAIEQHLKTRWGELFGVQYDLLLYDVTSTYFEGEAELNELARRGYSRDSRPDCKQVNIALVVTRDGMPLGYEVFAGNRTDVTTVEQIVSTMEERFGVADRVWVMDRGMTSAKNIAWLQQGGRKYVIGTPKSELKRWSRALMDGSDWQSVRDGVEAKVCRGPEGSETFLLCRSAARRGKEHAMHERFQQRIETRLATLKRRLESRKRPVDRAQTERQVGRILQANQRAGARYDVRVLDDPNVPAGLRAEWSLRADWDEWARASEGCYVLRTNVHDWSADAIWKTYVQLSEAEDAFRVQKTDLRIRPIWHQTAERVQAHILVCFLAFAMWKTLQRWMEATGLGNSPRTLLDEMRAIRSCDVVLPTAERDPRELRVRCVVRPERHHAVLLDRLGLRLPERLKIARAVAIDTEV
jgi:transposase